MTDSVGDLLTRIRNAYLVKKAEIVVPHSKMNEALVKIFREAGYLSEVRIRSDKKRKHIILSLNYIKGLAAVTKIKRMSKPGRRLYVRSDQIRVALSGSGMVVISTSKGLMTGKQARKKGLGGEFICTVW